MPYVITSITVQKKNRNRFNIFIDNQYAFSLNYSHALCLQEGDHLDGTKIEALKQTDEQDAAYSRALYYLKFRPRSRMEIKRYLKEKKFSSKAISKSITRLEANGYINDPDFARLWIKNRRRFRPKGVYVLKGELRAKGIDELIIKDVLMDFDETESAWAAAASRIPRLQTLEKNDFKRKLYAFLNRRGFVYSTCREICDQAWKQQTYTEKNK